MALTLGDPDAYTRTRLQECVAAMTYAFEFCGSGPDTPHLDVLKDILSRFKDELSRYLPKETTPVFDDIFGVMAPALREKIARRSAEAGADTTDPFIEAGGI